jgi:HlyD family secretion protein
MLKYITIFLSVVGLSVGLYAVSTADEKKPVLPLARPASVNPFESGIAALGLLEPAERIINSVAPEPGLVTQVFVSVGDKVTIGTPLFALDSRRLDSELVRARAQIATGQAAIERWKSLPRAENLPPLQATVAAASAQLKDREEQVSLVTESLARGSATDRDLSRATFAVAAARAELERAQADLAKEVAGGWKPDLDALTATLDAQQAEVTSLDLLKDRLTVRALRAGTVLRRDVEPGEFASTDSTRPAVIIGNLDQLHVRAQVDEEDIGLLSSGTPNVNMSQGTLPPLRAMARTRGAIVTDLTLELLRIEPFARPKSDLRGVNSERVDTRVIDVVFKVTAPPTNPIYPGQAVDVFIARTEP